MSVRYEVGEVISAEEQRWLDSDERGWTAVYATEICGVFLPPMEYTIKPGDTLEVWTDRGTVCCFRLNRKGPPIRHPGA